MRARDLVSSPRFIVWVIHECPAQNGAGKQDAILDAFANERESECLLSPVSACE